MRKPKPKRIIDLWAATSPHMTLALHLRKHWNDFPHISCVPASLNWIYETRILSIGSFLLYLKLGSTLVRLPKWLDSGEVKSYYENACENQVSAWHFFIMMLIRKQWTCARKQCKKLTRQQAVTEHLLCARDYSGMHLWLGSKASRNF